MIIGDDFFNLAPKTVKKQTTKKLTNPVPIKGKPKMNNNKISRLVNRSLNIFKEKLIDSGYNSDEIDKLLILLNRKISGNLRKSGLYIICTINLDNETLVDIFKDLKMDIAPLGHYEMIIDYWSNEISVSEVKGHHPQLIL